VTKLDKAKAMKCFGGLIERVELDPDPQTQEKLTEEFNCVGCDSFSYCRKLSDTLADS